MPTADPSRADSATAATDVRVPTIFRSRTVESAGGLPARPRRRAIVTGLRTAGPLLAAPRRLRGVTA